MGCSQLVCYTCGNIIGRCLLHNQWFISYSFLPQTTRLAEFGETPFSKGSDVPDREGAGAKGGPVARMVYTRLVVKRERQCSQVQNFKKFQKVCAAVPPSLL